MKRIPTIIKCILQNLVFVVVICILSTITPSFATTYYVDSNAGNDLNNGLSTGSAWQSLTKVNSFMFSPNDSILFIRNGVWRGQLIPKSGSALGHITYADYGTGAKPVFLGSVNKSLMSDWIHEGGNIWRCADTFLTDVGNLIFNNATSFGIKKWNLMDLVSQGDYWFNRSNGQLKIFSATHPATYYADIECAVRNHIVLFQNVSYVVFNNLSLKYGAAHGFGGGNTHHLIIRACDISYMGGGDLDQDGSNVRFGNGIEFWGNAHDNTVEQCKIWEIYDAGLSNQNHTNTVQQYNIRYQNNIIYNCALASFEYWNKPATSTTSDIYFENNTCVNAGYGWGVQRPDRVGAHVLLSYNEAITDSIFIRNNIFYNANACLAMPSTWNTTDGYQKLVLRNNCYYQAIPTDTLVFLFYSSAFNSSSFANYQSTTGQDVGSFINDPLFVNYQGNDFHITATSPLINQGYPTGILNDYDNEIRTLPIDIGADEYYPFTHVNEAQVRQTVFCVFPNPATDIITIISSDNNSQTPIQIYNVMGVLVKEHELSETTQIDIRSLQSGLYFIHFKNHPHQVGKFVKQ